MMPHKNNHAMIDIETLGKHYDCVVLTIGGCKFNPLTNNEPTDEILIKLTVEDQVEKGRKIDQSTLDWWGTKPAHVRAEAFDKNGRVSCEDGLALLNEWVKGSVKIWCQGPSFDMPILYSLFRDFESEPGWKFWNERDSRTITGLIPKAFKANMNFAAHTASADVIAQAKCVQEAFRVNNLDFII